MASCGCFCGLVRRNKKHKEERFRYVNKVHASIEGSVKSTAKSEKLKSAYVVPLSSENSGSSSKKIKVMSHENSFREAKEVEYEGEDEHESLSMNRESVDFDIQVTNEEFDESVRKEMSLHYTFDSYNNVNDQYRKESEKDEVVLENKKTGNVSDPGIGKRESWNSTLLKRSCSDLAMRVASKKISIEPPPLTSQSFEDMKRLTDKLTPGSPVSVSTHYSADKVLLKKHSSSHILPSRSRKLWWKLFLWSHRNVKGIKNNKPQPIPDKITLSKQGGYSSDTIEPGKGMDLVSKLQLDPEKLFRKGSNKKENHALDDIHGVTGLWPQNQWVSSPAESSTFSRVEEWVKELSVPPPRLIDEDDHIKDDTDILPPLPVAGKSLARNLSLMSRRSNKPEEITHANSVIQSLNSSSTVAHITGTGLKVNPVMSHFSFLRSVNLSNNSIVQITPGSLPKSLHILNLSRNQIHTIGGLKELTRLRVLDLSYNRISRIGRGLSNCTLIKELYLTANKISYVEGLHRLLKLTVLDLSFNKITSTNALRQLVANYNSLTALNLLGNPIQCISEEQFRKKVCSLVQKLVFLNKQPITQQKAREQAVADAAVGNSSWSSRRRKSRKINVGASSSSSYKMQRSNTFISHKKKLKLRSRSQHQSS